MCVGNMAAVEPAFEKATEPFDCENAADAGRGLGGRLESIDEKVDRRFSHVDCEVEDAVAEGSLSSSPSLSFPDCDPMPSLSLDRESRLKDVMLLKSRLLRPCPETRSLETADRNDCCAVKEKLVGDERGKEIGSA